MTNYCITHFLPQWRKHSTLWLLEVTHFIVISQPVYWVTWKAPALSESHGGKGSATNSDCGVKGIIAWVILSSRHYDVGGKCWGKMPYGAMASPSGRITTLVHGILEQGHGLFHGELYGLWETVPDMLMSPSRNGMLDQKTQCDHSPTAAIIN